MDSLEMWNKYKSLELWKRILLIVPALVAVALAAAWFVLRPNGAGALGSLLEDKQKETDEVVTNAEAKIKDAEDKMGKLRVEREKIKEEVKKNVQDANDIDDRIDAADSFDELERIRAEIAGRLRGSS